jgi:ABC-type molybdate transport system substrate-binding protein
MKSLKSLFALLAIVTLSVGCAATNDAPAAQTQDTADAITTVADDAGFSFGNDVKPIIIKPEI